MNNIRRKYIFIVLLVVATSFALFSSVALIFNGSPLTKSYNEHIISGNTMYSDSLYDGAIEHYLYALDIDSVKSIGNFNSATNLLMKVYSDARSKGSVSKEFVTNSNRMFNTAYKNETDKNKKSEVMHNLGLLHHITDSLEQAEEAYKESLRGNPYDEGTRYNLAVVQYLLKKQQDQQNQDQQDQQNQNQQDQQNQDQQNQDQQDQQDQQNQDQQDQQNQDEQDQQNQDQQNQQNQQNQDQQDQQNQDQQNQDQQNQKNQNVSAVPNEEEMRSKEEAERILDAVTIDEKGVIEKVNKDKKKTGKKDLLKNW
ncbi:MAG: hypothetical protein IKL75_04605 [Bacteroidaceae bacterium]|nr:hypothetical protein [Bacteroidaceae bacterium]